MQTSRFLKKAIIFAILNAVILAGALYFFSGRNRDIRMPNWETESNLLAMGSAETYGLVLLSTSRGRVFSRDGNHLTLEKILGTRVMNLSKGGGGGLMPAELHLSYFYHRGNRADHVVYLVDTSVFFSPISNEQNDFFLRDEPFELFILGKLIADRYPADRVLSYLQMIAVKDWAAISRYGAPGLTDGILANIDTLKLREARQYYLERYAPDGWEKYSPYVDKINALVKAHGGRITYVMLPMLIPDFPKAAQVDAKLRQVARDNDHVDYFNFADAMHDRRFFYDHMHFNKVGIDYFTRNCLYPILHGGTPRL